MDEQLQTQLYENRKYDDREYILYLTELLELQNFAKLRAELEDDNEVDIANFLDTLSDDKVALVFRMLPKDMGAEVFAHLSTEAQYNVALAFSDVETSQLLEELFVDDAVDFLEEMPANLVTRVLRLTSSQKRTTINRILQYPENSAGSIMTTEYISFHKDMTVGQSLEYLRRYGHNKETIYTCYVTNPSRILEGVISVKTLLLSEDREIIGDIMETDVIKVNTADDQEDVALLFHKYDFLAVPVVDKENRLVGIVTVDDAVDIIQAETTEDFAKMAAVGPSEIPYMKSSVWEMGRNRIVWLLILMVSAIFSGLIIQNYESTLLLYPLLFSFVPMLTATGGNVGAQSSTLIIRGMAVGDVNIRDIGKVIWKEFRTGILLGLTLGAINFLRIAIIYDDLMIAIVLSISMLFTVLIAAVIGSSLPMFAKALNIDPAIMATPLITTLVDLSALTVYFLIATALLPGL
ncbi:MAG: magnesium transporter [Eubacteriales bacterium]|nr:magnesium transporter [Eubacteriales bacterium]